jgi:NAD(P)-dependent dehydrogenase (short-subunit alcohol dehydrogenase family)
MNEKHVLITGAGGNLARTVIQKFLDHNYSVSGTVTPGKKLDFHHPRLTEYALDLTHEHDVEKMMEKDCENHNQLDAAVLLAGGFRMGKLESTGAEDFHAMISINFETALHVARCAMKKMKTQHQGGRIILIGARPGLSVAEGKSSVAYALSKSLIFRLAELLNLDGKSHRVITSVLVPGTIDTPVNRAAMPDADFSQWVSPETLADTMLLLCSEQAETWREPIINF